MYRPAIDSQYRPRIAVPPPPPQGIMNYGPQRPLPPPIYASAYCSSQFSYATGPPPPSLAPEGASFSSSNLAVQSASPGFHAAPFVPPLPSDFPPPPPSSPPPSPPPLPPENSITSDSVLVGRLEKKVSSSDSLPAVKGSMDAKFRPGVYNNAQQKSLLRVSPEAASPATGQVDSENNVLHPRPCSDWNATYQDTLDDEASSPTASDMDMDLDDAGELREGHPKIMPKQDTFPANDAKKAGSQHDGQGHLSSHAMPRIVDDSPSSSYGIEFAGAEPEDCQTERPFRLSSSHPVKVMNEQIKSDGFLATGGGSETVGAFEMVPNNADTSTSSQAPDLTAGLGNMPLLITEEQDKMSIVNDTSIGPSKVHQISQQQEDEILTTMDEFGRLAQKVESDGEPDESKHEPPVDEFGRVMRKGMSGSDSEGNRHTSKRKRNFSRSRSRSRDAGRGMGRGRGRSRSSSRSRSRSWSWSNQSRSRSRSSSSRSPARSSRRRRQSYSRSPRRQMRWSRSESQSPEWRRSSSRTPPPRDMRWSIGRGDRDWRGDREYFGRGRRGGRGPLNPCFHFARGRCFRGSSCWYPHVSREAMAQDRGTRRRDIQVERPNLDSREENSADQRGRGPWRREVRTEEPDDFGGGHQDNIEERQKNEFVLNSNVLQDDSVREPSFNRADIPFQQTDSWTSRGAEETKDRQVMAYNKALELVGIPHVPSEGVMTGEPVIHHEAQGHERTDAIPLVHGESVMTEEAVVNDDARGPRMSDGGTISSKDITQDGNMTKSEALMELTCMDSGDSGSQIPGFEARIDHKESSAMSADDITKTQTNDSTEKAKEIQHSDHMSQGFDSAEKCVLTNDSSDVVTDRRDELEQHAIEVHLHDHQDVQNVSGPEEYGDCREADSSKVLSLEGDMDAVKAPSGAAEMYSGSNQEADVLQEPEPRIDTDSDGGCHKGLDELDSDSNLKPVADSNVLEKDVIDPKDEFEQATTDVCKKPIPPADSDAAVNVEEHLKSDVEAEVNRNAIAHSVNVVEQTNASEISDWSDSGRVCTSAEGELPVTASKADSAEVIISHVESAPLLPHTPQVVLVEASSGYQGTGILRPPSEVQQYARPAQQISGPGLISPLPPQGQLQVSSYQPFPAQSYSSTPVQYPAGTRDTSQSANHSAYRFPAISSVTSQQTFDQAALPLTQFSSGNAAFPSVGGWGQGGFQARAPVDSLAVNQVYGHSSYGMPSRPNLGISTSGMPFYAATNQGDKYAHQHGVPYPSVQASHQESNPGDQFSQLQRPPSSGGFGHSNIGGYGSAYSGGFGVPNVGGSFSQHIPSNSGGFSQPQVMHTIAGSIPPPQPTQNHGPMFASQPLSQNYRPVSQPAYGSNCLGQPSSQNLPLSTPQGQVLNTSGNPSLAHLQIAMPQQGQQGFNSNATYLSEPSQSLNSFGFATANQGMQPNVANRNFLSNTAVSISPPVQPTDLWNLSQRPVMPPSGKASAYSYPLTTIPPLSGLVQIPQATSLAMQNDQYDPLSDVTGLGVGGAFKVVSATPLSDGRTGGLEKTKVEKAINPERKLEAAEVDAKTTIEDVGVVENLSPENWSPVPAREDTEEEGGKGQALSKKSNRGLKMLRAAIADHVKEVLKPTWKEGYMSKEAFKTIAKKAVEKVVANVPNHHIPKSQEKVDQFMKSSRPKISKLVQGYVDKYLKL